MSAPRRPDTASLRRRGAHQVPADEPPYEPLPGSPVCHIRFDDHVLLVAEHDLAGPLRDLVTAVLAADDAA